MFLAGIRIFLCLYLWNSVSSEPIGFNAFYSDGTLGRSLDSFSRFPFSSIVSPHYGSGLQLQESSNIPLYSDGSASASQLALSELEKTYKSQLLLASKLRTNAELALGPPSPRSPYRAGRKNNSPLHGQASAVYSERRFVPNQREKSPPTQRISTRVPTVQMESGFIPIIPGSSQDIRSSSHSLSSNVIKDVQPPILTAASSVVSSGGRYSITSDAKSSQPKNSSPRVEQQQTTTSSSVYVEIKPRQSNYSRSIVFKTQRNPALGSSLSESVISRVVVGSESVQNVGQKDIQRLNPPALLESKQAAKKKVDLNCDGSKDLGWCELGDKYPRQMVDDVVALCKDTIDKMHVEVPHSFERLSDTSDFKSELENGTREAKERGSHDAWSWSAYFHQGALCDAETGFLRPETAKDSSGKWNLIVQTEAIKQRVPIEMCRKTNSPCKKMLDCGLRSQCLQKYNYHLLLSLNPTTPNECPFMKLYRFPSACVCHVE